MQSRVSIVDLWAERKNGEKHFPKSSTAKIIFGKVCWQEKFSSPNAHEAEEIRENIKNSLLGKLNHKSSPTALCFSVVDLNISLRSLFGEEICAFIRRHRLLIERNLRLCKVGVSHQQIFVAEKRAEKHDVEFTEQNVMRKLVKIVNSEKNGMEEKSIKGLRSSCVVTYAKCWVVVSWRSD